MSQPVFATLYKHWIWAGPPVFLLALAALIFAIVGVVHTVRRAHLFKVPLREKQAVQFQAAGRVVLSTEGPRLSNRFRGVKFEMRGIDGDPVPRRRAVFRAQTSGISTVRTETAIFEIPRPGRYLLTAAGLGGERANDASHALVFMKPHLGRSVLFVLGILLASGVMITSLVFFLMRLRGVALES